jgi:hypothetical protein
VAFVPGYPRDLGWVKAHRRRPNRAEAGQLPLLPDAPDRPPPTEPPPDPPPGAEPPGANGTVAR